ncbi:MAG: DUF4037 domain-containing protein [Lachnospiraceae bacterium]|nr:DUF4037 domain-containing protein [Lachnospiraceae bacterium]
MEQKQTYGEYKKGLELSKEYFEQMVEPVLKDEFSDYIGRMAAGCMGAGSECYGYDDVMSRDREFGVSYQLLIPGEDMEAYGKRLKARLNQMPDTYGDYKVLRNERCGLMSVEEFYEYYLGLPEGPIREEDWESLGDAALSTATNGEVFFDHFGRFSTIRTILGQGYPKKEQFKRLAASCEQAGKSGQYNLYRCISRRQWVAASMVMTNFMDAASQIVFLLNYTYRPYFKWFPNEMAKLPILGEKISRNMEYFSILSIKQDKGTVVAMAQNMSLMLIEALKEVKITVGESKLLVDHAREIREKYL